MSYSFYINAKTDRIKNLFRNMYSIEESVRSNHGPWRCIRNAEHNITAALISNGNAILE